MMAWTPEDVTSARFTTDGSSAIAVFTSRAIGQYSTTTGQLSRLFPAPDANVRASLASADGRFVFLLDETGAVSTVGHSRLRRRRMGGAAFASKSVNLANSRRRTDFRPGCLRDCPPHAGKITQSPREGWRSGNEHEVRRARCVKIVEMRELDGSRKLLELNPLRIRVENVKRKALPLFRMHED